MHTIRAAVIGTGFIGPAHVEALRRLGIEVLGVAGSSPERARPKAEALHIPQVYADWRELVADPAVNVVHVTSPNHLHYPMARAAIAAGKHVVCEKPLAMNAHESGELLRLAQEAGIVHAVNYNLRFYPMCQEARARAARGDLGDVYIIRGSYLQDWLFYATDWNWRLEPELGGSLRAVADIGTHWLDLISFITGLRVRAVLADLRTFIPVRKKPAKPIDTFAGKVQSAAEGKVQSAAEGKVQSEAEGKVQSGAEGKVQSEAEGKVQSEAEDYVEQPIHTEDYATVLLAYEGGARGVVTVSQVSAGRKNRLAFEIDGSKMALAWDSERPNELWIGRRDGPNEVLVKDPALLTPEAQACTGYPGGHNEGYPDTFKQLYRAVYRYVRANDLAAPTDFPTFADGHEQILLCEAIQRSAQENRWVEVNR